MRTIKQKWIRRIIVFLCIVSVWGMSGCAASVEKNTEQTAVSVVATIFAPYDFTRAIIKDLSSEIGLTMLLKPGAEAHTYEPSPQDIITIQNADIFIYVGGENDAWVDTILESMDTSGMQIIKMMDHVALYEEETVEGMEESHEHHGDSHEEDHEHEHEGDHEEWDEHVWTDPQNAVKISQVIAEALKSELSKQGKDQTAEQIGQNMQDYASALLELDGAFREVVADAERTVMVFGDRYPLRYFSEAYGIDYYAAFPGCSTESEPSANTMAFLIDFVREEHIPVVFQIELSNGKIAETIAADTDAVVRTFYTCHTISKDDFAQGETYLSMMWKNVAALKEALN